MKLQVSNERTHIPHSVLKDKNLTYHEMLVLSEFINGYRYFKGRYDRPYTPKLGKFAEYFGISRDEVREAMEGLAQKDYCTYKSIVEDGFKKYVIELDLYE